MASYPILPPLESAPERYHSILTDDPIFMHRKLDLSNSPLLIGGIKDFDRSLDHPGQHIQADDFLGCMRNVFINGKKLDPTSAIDSAGIIDRCPRLGQCASGKCKNGGKCVDYWFDYICECADGYSGRNCEQG